MGVHEGIIEMLEAMCAGFEGVSLDIGVVLWAGEPLSAEIAFEVIGGDIVLMGHAGEPLIILIPLLKLWEFNTKFLQRFAWII